MLKKMIVLVAVVVLFFMSTNAFGESYLKDKSLGGLIINKAAFDDTCNTIILTLANLPECEECPDAIVTSNALRQATKKLEKINENLIFAIPDPEELTLKQKAAAGLIYRTIADNAYMIADVFGLWTYAPVVGVLGLVLDTADDADSDNCNSIENADDCEEAGCYWYIDNYQQGQCISGRANIQP